MNVGRLFGLGWRVVPRLPDALGRALFDAAALVVWARRTDGVRRLESNLARARPTASPRELRRLSRAGMRSYMRYYCETFQMPGWGADLLRAKVRAVGATPLQEDLAAGRAVILVLGHTGNWDLAGAWTAQEIGPVVTVAERLEPAELFDEYVAFRESRGISVIPLDRGANVFRSLVGHAKRGGVVIPLLADRDLTSSGVVVDLLGEPARVAPGAAALTIATGARLYPTRVTYERLRGARRRAARGPWGVVIDFAPPVVVPEGVSRPEAVVALSQAWADSVAEAIRTSPQDWHMLQRVFVADLDPARAPTADVTP